MHRLLMIGLATTMLSATPVLAQRAVPGHAGAMAGRHGMAAMHGRGTIHHRPQVHRNIVRGQHIGRYWSGPRVHLRNYALYGLTPPAFGDRWVRYYDDAVLIGRDGRIRDSRAGLDWDAYGERWERDDDIPAYAQDYAADDYGADPYDYYDDRGRDDDFRGRHDDRGSYDDEDYRGYPAGRTVTERFEGYRPITGYYPPGTIITETVVTTPPTVTTETYYVGRPARHHAVKAKRHHRRPPPPPPPPPYPGERG